MVQIDWGAFDGCSWPDLEYTLPDSVIGATEEAQPFVGLELKKLTVPAGYEGYDGEYTFGDSNIHEIDISACNVSLVEASTGLFSNSPNLEKVTLPEGITTIGANWFQNCPSLTSFEIPASVTSIGANAFSGTGITNLTIPETVTTISGNAFSGMANLQSVTINATIVSKTDAGASAFAKLEQLSTVVIGPEVRFIGDTWFQNCTALTAIDLSGATTLKEIGANAFSGSALSTITLPTTVATLGDGAFSNTQLTKVTLPDTRVIPANLFKGSALLEWVKLGNDVVSIGSSAFEACPELKFVNLPESVATIESCFKDSTNVHVFVPAKWAGFGGTAEWWWPAENNHLYFADDAYTTVAGRGLSWLHGQSLDSVTFGSTYEAALQASGATDFPRA